MNLIRITVAVLILPLGDISSLPANDSPRSDQLTLNSLFGDHTLSQNVRHVRERTASLDDETRYDSLLAWLLPSESHHSIRLSAEFVPTDAPLAQAGGTLVSPAFDLIATAAELDRLDELQEFIEATSFEGELEQRDRLALLFLTHVVRRDFENALLAFDELEERHQNRVYPELHDRWPETLVLWKAAEIPEFHAAIAPLLNRIHTSQARTGENGGPDVWDRHISALAAIVNESLSPRGHPNSHDERELQNWIPVSHGDCVTRAHGFPQADWTRQGEEFVNLLSRQEDYLYYRIPLEGNFEVECDLAGFDYRDTELMVHGICLVPQFNHEELVLRDLRGERGRFELDPPLSQSNEWIHHRVVVKDRNCAIFLNGREVYRRDIPQHASPWLAVRSPFYAQSRVRDVRISGTPDIPHELSLTSNRELAGWLIDNPDAVRNQQSWRFNKLIGPEGGVISPLQPELRGSYQENLLRYERPLLEDAEVEYEFYYQPDRIHVHPVLDRRAYLLRPDGVYIHRITDGVWDRSELDPQNMSTPPDNVLRSNTLPLREGWNHLQMSCRQEQLSLELNGQPIYQEPLNSSRPRTFGLFHYADQTEVRVRNVRYRGDWPRNLPPVSGQELHDTRVDRIDAGVDSLNDEAIYSFKNRQYATDRFTHYTSDGKGEITPQNEGLKLHKPGSKPFSNTWISPRIRVTGDFDIEAEYEQLDLKVTEHGGSSIYLTVATTDRDRTHAHVNRGAWRNPNERLKSDVQAEFNLLKPKGAELQFEGRRAEESVSGRLRVARRGKKLYLLFSERDSSVYRLIHEQEVNDLPLMEHGIRLAAGSWSDGQTLGSATVVWKRLSVKADSIEEMP